MSGRPTTREIALFLAAFIVIVVSSKLVYAKFVYDDVRCAFADCRIVVDQ